MREFHFRTFFRLFACNHVCFVCIYTYVYMYVCTYVQLCNHVCFVYIYNVYVRTIMRTYASHRMTHHAVSPVGILPYQSVIHIQRCAHFSRAGRSDAAESMAWCKTQENGGFDSNQKASSQAEEPEALWQIKINSIQFRGILAG